MLKVATVCSGIGSPEQALVNLGIEHEISFACEIDKYARQTYMANFNPTFMVPDMTKETWEGNEFYSDLFIGGIPCQSFSLAGKRLGELDPRGLLFYDFYRYVQVQQPKYFIIENVKGLLSDDNGKTFRNWIQLLGRSENTHINMFNHPDSLEYNLHWKVLNSKDFGVPQNRERVFLVGIRKDLPNTFRFPIGERLTVRLKDILEVNVPEKYYLSDKYLQSLVTHSDRHQEKGNGFKFEPTDGNCIASAITTKADQRTTDNYIKEPICVDMIGREPQVLTPIRTEYGKQIRKEYEQGKIKTERKNIQKLEPRKDGITNTITSVQKDNLILEPRIIKAGQLPGPHESSGRIYSIEGLSPTITAKHGGGHEPFIKVKEATKQGYAIAKEGDSINLSNPNSETRRGRVGNQIANTLDTACNQGVVEPSYRIRRLTPLECFRLQGFPDSYIKPCSDSQTYKQAGNSITVNVMQAILKNLLT